MATATPAATGGPGRHRRDVRLDPIGATTRETGLSRLAGPWWAVALLGLGYAGYIKGIPVMAWFPVDLTGTFVALCALGVAAQVLRRNKTDVRAATAITGLWCVFSIGAAMSIGGENGSGKVVMLGTVTLLAALAPCYLLAGAEAQRWWLTATVAAALVLGLATMLMPDSSTRDIFGRLTVVGTSTIGTSRVMGAGILVAVIFAVTERRRGRGRRWLWWACAFGASVALMANGSRGPLLGLLVALVAVVVTGRVFAGRRLRTLGSLGLIGSVLAVIYASSPSAVRSLLLVTGEQSDVAREFLLEQAWNSMLENPLGIGWGAFSTTSSVELVYGGRTVYPHNMILETMVEGGWIAGVFLVILVYFSMRGYLRASDTPQRAALFGLGLYWFAVAQTSSDVNGNRMTWITLTLGLMMAARDTFRSSRV